MAKRFARDFERLAKYYNNPITAAQQLGIEPRSTSAKAPALSPSARAAISDYLANLSRTERRKFKSTLIKEARADNVNLEGLIRPTRRQSSSW